MLEVCPTISGGKPSCEIHPLSIGARSDPVRLVFTAAPGRPSSWLLDLGNRFRLVANDVEVVEPEACRVCRSRERSGMQPNFATAAEGWLEAGGPHHTSFTQALTMEAISDLAEIAGIEIVVIDESTTVAGLKHELRWNHAYYHQAQGVARWPTMASCGSGCSREIAGSSAPGSSSSRWESASTTENVLAIRPTVPVRGGRDRKRSSSSTWRRATSWRRLGRPPTRPRTPSSPPVRGARRHRPHALALRDRVGAGGTRPACFGTTTPTTSAARTGDTGAGGGRDPGGLRGADRRRDRRDVRESGARSARDAGGPRGLHGPFAWGVDVAEAVENATALETVAELALYTLVLRAETAALDGELLERHFTRKHGPDAYYGQPR